MTPAEEAAFQAGLEAAARIVEQLPCPDTRQDVAAAIRALPVPSGGEVEEPTLTDEEIVEKANKLANRLYRVVHGRIAEADFCFYEAKATRERNMWDAARVAFIELTDTDIDDALSAVDTEELRAARGQP